ncbi:chymotrypsinogen B-like [Phymastichus coffea]|uniref:chymotrypsinogen B-like n=1 Tax=Phymastichus coffea TaxID=108790 RepID=UPI00273BEF0A|nr:chymotrypsinogen B-like [Phymastichus coffea]
MSLKLVLFCFFVASSSAAKRLPRLAGGEDAKPGQYPYQVNLYYKSLLETRYPIAFGGGAILNKQWILTAAYNIQNLKNTVVKAGNIYLNKSSKSEQISNVANAFVHPKYQNPTGPYDIALIKLETPLEFNEFVKPIDLPQIGSHPQGFGVLTGLGSLTHMTQLILAKTLQALTLPIISNDDCQYAIDAALGAGQFDFFGDDLAFCTGSTETNQGYCLHDTGNPLVIEENGKKVVAGVATFGFAADCTTPNTPSIYTRVSAFNDWIHEIMSEF